MDTVTDFRCGRSCCDLQMCRDCYPNGGEYAKPTRAEEVADKLRLKGLVVPSQPAASDGSASSYYELPKGATELRHLIQAKNMNFAVGNIFKACYRLGQKLGNDLLYDIRKIVFFGLDQMGRASGDRYKEELLKLKEHIDKELARLG